MDLIKRLWRLLKLLLAWLRRKWFILLAILVMVSFFTYHESGPSTPKAASESLSQLTTQISGHLVKSASFVSSSHEVTVTLANGRQFKAMYPDSYESTLTQLFQSSGVPFDAKTPPSSSFFGGIFSFIGPLLPLLIMYVGYTFLMNRKRPGSKLKADVQTGKDLPTERFSDVKGADEVVKRLSHLVGFLRDPEQYTKRGIDVSRGVLLYGPPGTGKTMIARALAGEAGVDFTFLSGSAFKGMWAGQTTERIREAFEGLKGERPRIVFIDEIDAAGSSRSTGNAAADDHSNSLIELMQEMDRLFRENPYVVIIATTNRKDILDSALIRHGRLGLHLPMPEPSMQGREDILRANAMKITGMGDIDFKALAVLTPGMSGADLANVPHQAALLAMDEAAELTSPKESGAISTVEHRHFVEALAQHSMGIPRYSDIRPEQEMEETAWHEGGHAITAMLLPGADQPNRVTIVGAGDSGGSTWFIPQDLSYYTEEMLRGKLTVAMGGWAAESIRLDGKFTTGSTSDREHATRIATEMVCRFGMGSKFSSIEPNKLDSHPEARALRREIDKLIEEALAAAERLLRANMKAFEHLVQLLMKDYTVYEQQLEEIRAMLGS